MPEKSELRGTYSKLNLSKTELRKTDKPELSYQIRILRIPKGQN